MMRLCHLIVILMLWDVVSAISWLTNPRCSSGYIGNVTLETSKSTVKKNLKGTDIVVATKELLGYVRRSPFFSVSNTNIHKDHLNIEWIRSTCPNTIEHFKRFPYFDYSDSFGKFPALTTGRCVILL